MYMRLKQRESFDVAPSETNVQKDLEVNPAEASVPAANTLAFQLTKMSLEVFGLLNTRVLRIYEFTAGKKG